MNRITTLLAVLALHAAPVAADESVSGDALLEARLEAHITFLADDLLRGRQPGTPGYEIAARYVASQFRQLGLAPAGTDGYFQPVPLRRAWLEDGSAAMRHEHAGGVREFRFVDEFYIGPGMQRTVNAVTAPLVFAGYGIVAPPLGHDDYADLDVAGRIVVVLAGMPQAFPSEEGAHFSNRREIARNAMERGAVGLVRIHTPRSEQRFAWERLRSMVGTPSMSWLDESGEPYPDFGSLEVNAYLHHEAAAALFEGADRPVADLLAADEAGEALPRFELPGTLQLERRSRHEAISSPNVAAWLSGSDPTLAGEFVVYTAHLDHIGELAHGDGHADAINNGALDNASGTAVMLETARLFAENGAPRRSVLFLAVTAEEKGLVGSEYFAHHPTVPIERMAGLVNLDMPLLLYDFGDVIAFGAEHSTLGDAVAAAAGEFGIALTPDPFPEQNIFVRSDHYRFVQQGVPAVFLVTGTTSRDGATDTQAIFEGFLKDHYHRPSDDLDLPIDYGAAARFTRINARIGEIVGNDRVRPRWREGDFFGETFGR